MNKSTVQTLLNDRELTQKPSAKKMLSRELILCAAVPIVIFVVLNHYGMRLIGTISAGIWCCGIVLFKLIKERSISPFGIIGAIFSGIGLVGTLISRNPEFYLDSPIVSDALLALVFFGSLFFHKPLIQVFAEASFKGFPKEFQEKPRYKSAWTILTIMWGGLSLIQAIVRIILLATVSKALYFSVSTIFGNVSTPLMLGFTFWFPKWYWKKTKTI